MSGGTDLATVTAEMARMARGARDTLWAARHGRASLR